MDRHGHCRDELEMAQDSTLKMRYKEKSEQLA
jgi:hypothetical protein